MFAAISQQQSKSLPRFSAVHLQLLHALKRDFDFATCTLQGACNVLVNRCNVTTFVHAKALQKLHDLVHMRFWRLRFVCFLHCWCVNEQFVLTFDVLLLFRSNP